MSSIVLLLLLLLCLHACNARHIGIIDKETRRNLYLPMKVDVEKEEVRETLIPSMPRSQENFTVEEDSRKFSRSGANNMKENDSKSHRKEEDTMEVTPVVGRARNEDFSVSSQEGLQQPTKIMRMERKARSMLASLPDDTEETVDSKGNTAVEDIVVMDYAQPHRKPPIHNREP